MKVYKGIKYADAARFAKPLQVAKLNSPDAVETAVKICPQNPSRLDRVIGRSGYSEPQSEDCLRLAVYTPSTDGCHPVLVWIHGGAYLTGSALYDIYDASRLAEEGNIVVVSISYRLTASLNSEPSIAWNFLYSSVITAPGKMLHSCKGFLWMNMRLNQEY